MEGVDNPVPILTDEFTDRLEDVGRNCSADSKDLNDKNVQSSIMKNVDKPERGSSVKSDLITSDFEENEVSSSRGPLLKIFDAILARRGIFYAVLSAFFYSGQGFFFELIPTRLSVFQIVCLAMPPILVGSLIVIIIIRAPRPKQVTDYPWLVLNGLSVSFATATFVLAVRYLDVGDATAVAYSSLIFVCILSWVILKEPLGIFDFVFSSIALAGVVFIARPYPLFGQSQQERNDNTSTADDYLIGIAFALGCALGMAVRNISFRKQTQLEINKFVATFSMACVIAVSNAVVCTALNQWRVIHLIEWVCATSSGLCCFLAQLCLFTSLTLETTTMVSIIITLDIAFSFLLQFVFLNVSPAWTSYVGAVLLIVASIGITVYKSRTADAGTESQVTNARQEREPSNHSKEIS